MPFLDLENLPVREVLPGHRARFVHSEHLTFAYWWIDAGAKLPAHRHPHEQVATMLEGQYALTVDGQTKVVQPGEVAVIPSNVEHSGVAVTDCRILDVFYPIREEYR